MDRCEAENLILSMADIVMENRELRKDVARLQKVEEEYHNYVMERCMASEEGVKDALRVSMMNICSGINIANMWKGE